MRFLCLFSLLTCFIAGFAQADTVFLANGDRITCEFQGIANGVIAASTSYAGGLQIKQEEALGLSTDEAWQVLLSDGETYAGKLTWQDNVFAVQQESAYVPFALSDVAAVFAIGAEAPAPEPEAPAEKEKIWSGTADLGMTIKQGTTDTTDVSGKITLVRKRPKHTLTLSASGLYGEVESQVNTRRYAGNAELKLTPWKRFYTFGYTGIEHDAGRQLEFRWSSGAGIGYTIIANERRNLSAEAGLEYAREEWNEFSLTDEDRIRDQIFNANLGDIRRLLLQLRSNPVLNVPNLRSIGRTAFDISQRDASNDSRIEDDINLRFGAHYDQKIFKHSQISGDVTLIPAIDDWSDYRFTSDVAWQTPVSENLALRLNLLNEYESEPEQDRVDNWETTFTTSLRYEF